MRLDQWLVKSKLAPSRTKAQELIRGGQVEVLVRDQWELIFQPSFIMNKAFQARLLSAKLLRYVSRAGLKMEGALEHLGLDVKGLRALDIGISTGGFSDCLLKKGCHSVVGIDVGQGQLHSRLRDHPCLIDFEGLHFKDISDHAEFQNLLGKGFSLVVLDVSFCSLTQVMPYLPPVLSQEGIVLALVKPQFEVGAENLNKAGVVKDSGLYRQVEVKICDCVNALGFEVKDYFPSQLRGTGGNQEYFLFLHWRHQ